MNRFKAILDEGSCYRISNFGIGENGGKYPLLSHKFKISFFKNTAVTRVNNFDNNQRGFCFEPFTNFSLKTFSERDMVGKSLFHCFNCFFHHISFCIAIDRNGFHLHIIDEDVIGTIISISQPIPFEYNGKEKMRKTVILQDIE